MKTFAAILGLGFIILGLNDVADHAPSKYQSYVLTGKLELGGVLLGFFIVLFSLLLFKLKDIQFKVNMNVPKKQFIHVKATAFMTASPVEIAKVIQERQYQWSMSGDLGQFKTIA